MLPAQSRSIRQKPRRPPTGHNGKARHRPHQACHIRLHIVPLAQRLIHLGARANPGQNAAQQIRKGARHQDVGAFEAAAGGVVPAADGAFEQACPGNGTDGPAQGKHDFGGRANVDRAAGGRARRVRRGDGRRRRTGKPRVGAERHSFGPALEKERSNGFVPWPASRCWEVIVESETMKR